MFVKGGVYVISIDFVLIALTLFLQTVPIIFWFKPWRGRLSNKTLRFFIFDQNLGGKRWELYTLNTCIFNLHNILSRQVGCSVHWKPFYKILKTQGDIDEKPVKMSPNQKCSQCVFINIAEHFQSFWKHYFSIDW